jgi:hypothetical protein
VERVEVHHLTQPVFVRGNTIGAIIQNHVALFFDEKRRLPAQAAKPVSQRKDRPCGRHFQYLNFGGLTFALACSRDAAYGCTRFWSAFIPA